MNREMIYILCSFAGNATPGVESGLIPVRHFEPQRRREGGAGTRRIYRRLWRIVTGDDSYPRTVITPGNGPARSD